jgi:hypothetical protein
MSEDMRVWYECRIAPTSANVAALRAVEIEWDDSARRLADWCGVDDEAIADVRQAMRRLAMEDAEAAQRNFARDRLQGPSGQSSSP